MAIKIKGIEATLSTFREADRRFKEAAARELEAGAKEIAALARMYAPIDRGDLVKSIRAQRVNETTSYKWRVKVGGNIGGRDVHEYAALVHERMLTTANAPSEPVEDFLRPGEKSREKAAALGVVVGGGYLRRAFNDLQADIRKRVRAGLQNEISGLSRKHARNK